MNLEIEFSNQQQRDFYYATARNQCFSGGFNNGKSFGGCLKALTLLTTFGNYRIGIGRQVFTDLKRSTMQTFFKLCPKELIARHNEQDGLTVLKNDSQIYWLHLDNVDESTARGLELNSLLIDQAEETEEKVYDVMDVRVGRWDEAVIPKQLLDANPNWPRNKKGKLIAPSYTMLLCNPDTQYHYIFRKYHPDSLERRENHFFTEGEWDPSLGSEEGYNEALKHDPEWVNKYVKGEWGISSAQIHRMYPTSSLEPDEELIDRILKKGNLFRVLDHGDASPTCCLWFAVLDGVYICYREYYVPNAPVSYHRKEIAALSGNEKYSANYADPQIFKMTAQSQGGFWSMADEYLTKSIEGPSLSWLPADNNEFATRNRINERLRPSTIFTHPLTKENPAPGIYFIKKTENYPNGCYHAITQLQSQRRKLLGYFEGKSVYCDDREESVTDHAYDPIRYFVAMHGSERSVPQRRAPERSIKWYKMLAKRSEGRQNVLVPASDSRN